MTPLADSKTSEATRTSRTYDLLLGGIALMVGGETLCFLGPEGYALLRGIVCHILLYCGVVCGLAGVILRFTHKS